MSRLRCPLRRQPPRATRQPWRSATIATPAGRACRDYATEGAEALTLSRCPAGRQNSVLSVTVPCWNSVPSQQCREVTVASAFRRTGPAKAGHYLTNCTDLTEDRLVLVELV